MLWFRKKHGEKGESKMNHPPTQPGSGKAMLESVRTGLNSQWFKSTTYSVLKEFEGKTQAKGVLNDTGKERAITSILASLDGAVEAFTADNDQEGLKTTANLFLIAYVKMGKPTLLDKCIDVCEKAGITSEEINGRILEVASKSSQIDIAVTLYSKVGAKDKLVGVGNKALSMYLESSDLDMDFKSRLFDYVVEAYKVADDKESLIQAGDKSLKDQMENRRLSRDEDWILDAQKAYEAAGAKDKLAKLADQYVNLYLKEGLEVWLDKAVVAYEKADVDYISKLNRLADKVEEKGREGMADIMRDKAKSS